MFLALLLLLVLDRQDLFLLVLYLLLSLLVVLLLYIDHEKLLQLVHLYTSNQNLHLDHYLDHYIRWFYIMWWLVPVPHV